MVGHSKLKAKLKVKLLRKVASEVHILLQSQRQRLVGGENVFTRHNKINIGVAEFHCGKASQKGQPSELSCNEFCRENA